MSYGIALAALVALGLAGCVSETRTVVASDDVCFTAYGFKVSSPEYRLCRDREAEARRQGRATPSYTEARIVADAQAACQSYGLHPYSDRYEQCVRNEHEARRPM
jgi:hypothetical protein